MEPGLSEADRVTALRQMLPATGAGIYLDTATAGPFPMETDRALREADQWELRVGRVGAGRADDIAQRDGEARAVMAAVIGADPDQLTLTGGLASAAAAYVASLPRRASERIVLVDGVSAVLRAAVRSVALTRGSELVEVPLRAVDELPFTARDALLVVGHVDAATGCLLPVPAIAARAHVVGALLLLDAGLSAGAVPLAAPALGADAIVVEGHRWLLGPQGTAALWQSASADERLTRALGLVDPLPRRTLLGLARSVGWLLMVVGLPWALERTRQLVETLLAALAAIPGVDVLTRSERAAALVAFRIRGWTAAEAADELGRRVFAIVGTDESAATLLASVGAWNGEDELRRFVEAVAELARHSPESLPRRPALLVLDPTAIGGGEKDLP